jgi:hypothetical protein
MRRLDGVCGTASKCCGNTKPTKSGTMETLVKAINDSAETFSDISSQAWKAAKAFLESKAD